MSNLGAYQEITTRAAKMGGVDALVSSIGRDAVARSAPGLVGVGVVVGGLVGGAVVRWGAPRIQSWWEARRADTIQAGEQAKQDLATLLEDEQPDPDQDGLTDD